MKNFSWNVALSDPMPEDNWDSHTGFIHQVVLDSYLKKPSSTRRMRILLVWPPHDEPIGAFYAG